MSRVCEVCGKRPDISRQVSYSGKHNPRKRLPNLQRVRAVYCGQRRRMLVCTRCLKAGKVQKAA
ncbi:MAG: 50S ribosomal protein L28 [Candidatus Acetothermia bacterium]|jgi:large subunit ribosomal protein L28|nr:50S ribosomal protein L28 [Candidatus Acetothermia bacterium]MDH7504867.1 50S ribosomal protein L28 [Candidatus Acetothermia bacterium]